MSIILWCRSAADVSRSDMQRNLFSDYGGSFDAKHLARPTQMNFGHLPTIQGLRRNHGSLLKAGCLGNLFLRLVGLLSKKLTNAAFTSSACVHVMQCGPSFTTTRRDPLMSLAVRNPVAVIGRMRSASP